MGSTIVDRYEHSKLEAVLQKQISDSFKVSDPEVAVTGGFLTDLDTSKPTACPDTMDRARQQIRSAQYSVMEFDKGKAGLEVVIPLVGGRYNVLNSLEIFAGK